MAPSVDRHTFNQVTTGGTFVTNVRGQVRRTATTEPRYWFIGDGGFGTKEAARTARQLLWYRVHGELALATLIELDKQQERMAAQAIPEMIPHIYPTAAGAGQTILPEGFGRRPINEVWALRDKWIPVIDQVIAESVHLLRAAECWPSLVAIFWSPGGHGLLAAYIAQQVAHAFPRAVRLGITVVPEDEASRDEFLALLEAMTTA